MTAPLLICAALVLAETGRFLEVAFDSENRARWWVLGPLLAIGALVVAGTYAAQRWEIVTVTAQGVWPSRHRNQRIPAAHIADLRALQWQSVSHETASATAATSSRCFMGLQLIDGRYAQLKALERARSTWRRPGRVFVASSEDARWRPLRDGQGRVVPRWGELERPIRYWTLATERQPTLFGRHAWLGFDERGVVLQRLLRRTRLPYDRVDRFDFELVQQSEDDEFWRLVLVRDDGAGIPLTGVEHGHFTGNRLFWRVTGQESLGRNGATGGFDLGNDDADVLAALFNAQLAAAKAASRGDSAAEGFGVAGALLGGEVGEPADERPRAA